jgi:hypothetical protein
LFNVEIIAQDLAISQLLQQGFLSDGASSVKLAQAGNLLRVKPDTHKVTVHMAAAGGFILAEVLRMELQAVVDHILHILRNHHHGAVTLTAIDALCFSGLGSQFLA